MPIKRADTSQSPRRHRQGSKRYSLLLPWLDYKSHCGGQTRHDPYKRHSNLQTYNANNKHLSYIYDTSFLLITQITIDGDVESNPGPNQSTYNSTIGRPKGQTKKKGFRGTPKKANGKENVAVKKVIGLKNIGQNVCFFNSIVQSLYTIDSFCESVKSLDTDNPSRLAIKELFSTIERSETPIETYQFIKSIELPGYDYIRREQFDAQESMMHILNHVYNLNPDGSVPTESLFRLSFLESVLCQNCNNASEKTVFDNMCQIRFSDPNNPENSVKDSIEKLTNDPYGNFLQDSYECANCPIKTNATQNITLLNVSDSLIIQLVIFSFNQTTGAPLKLSPNLAIETKIENILLGTFELTAIIYHHGHTANSGHYTAVVKHGEQWYSVDDDRVLPIEADVFKCSVKDHMVPYILLYRKFNREINLMPVNANNQLDNPDHIKDDINVSTGCSKSPIPTEKRFSLTKDKKNESGVEEFVLFDKQNSEQMMKKHFLRK
ncbi:uncharacterized protein [Clytia hemisphaerica]|uniref:uncharacterized protein n=1 Tax=Clytia hemisphaerica TaxID=252671 RepID=UPI0034D704BE